MINASAVQYRINFAGTKRLAVWLLAFAIITIIWLGGEIWPWGGESTKGTQLEN